MKNLKEKIKINKIIEKIKTSQVFEKIKIFFSKKNNLITFISILLVLVVIFIIVMIVKNKDDKFALNEIYDVVPEEVRELYANMVEVSCYGDLYFDIQLDAGAVEVDKIPMNNLIDYMLSNLDKKQKLTKEFDANLLKTTAKQLFYADLDFSQQFNSYGYGNYAYTINDDVVVRKEKECVVDKKYVTHLYGYSFDEQQLSMDVNVGYLVDGVLYDLNDNKLGSYDGDVKKLRDLFEVNPYYRLNYVKNEKFFKLYSVELNSKS